MTRYVRVGVMDEPGRFPPQAPIFWRSRPRWLVLADDAPKFETWYDAARLWPAESLARHAEAKRLKALKTRETRPEAGAKAR